MVIAAILFGINGGLTRVPVQAGLPTETFTALRLVGAFIGFLVLALLFDRQALRPPRGKALWLTMLLGAFGVAFVQWTYNVAVQRLPLGLTLLLEYLAPVYVVLWVHFVRKQKVHSRVWPGVGLALVGLALVGQVWGPVELDPFGLLMAVAAGFCFAVYFLVGESLTAHDAGAARPLHVVVWGFGFGSATVLLLTRSLPGMAVLKEPVSLLGSLGEITVPAWAPMLAVIVFGTLVPFFLYLAALRDLPSSTATVTAMLEPLAAVAVGWLWFHEVLDTSQTLGVAAVMAGIILAQTARRKPAPIVIVEP